MDLKERQLKVDKARRRRKDVRGCGGKVEILGCEAMRKDQDVANRMLAAPQARGLDATLRAGAAGNGRASWGRQVASQL